MDKKRTVVAFYGCNGVGKTRGKVYITEEVLNIGDFKFASFVPSLKLKDIANYVFPEINPHEKKEDNIRGSEHTVRDFLLDLGQLIKKFDQNYFIKQVEELDKTLDDRTIIVVDNIRYKHEYEYFKEKFNLIVVEPIALFETKKTNDWCDPIPVDYKINNDGTENYYVLVDDTFSNICNSLLV